MKTLMLVVGIVALVIGAFWALQGAGIVHWPPVTPGQFTMVGDQHWTYYGSVVAIIGIGLIWYSRR